MEGEGHYLALLKKEGEKPLRAEQVSSGKGKDRLPEELADFLSLVSRDFDPARIEIRGGKVYFMPDGLPSMKGIRFLRTGLLLGELKKNRFEPSQALAMNLKK